MSLLTEHLSFGHAETGERYAVLCAEPIVAQLRTEQLQWWAKQAMKSCITSFVMKYRTPLAVYTRGKKHYNAYTEQQNQGERKEYTSEELVHGLQDSIPDQVRQAGRSER